jgi:hypothetical protein
MRGATARRAPWPIQAAHAALGAAGLAMLVLTLRLGLPASDTGTGGFGLLATSLLTLALLLGLAIAFIPVRRRPTGVLIAIHASFAVAGFVVLWTLVALG